MFGIETASALRVQSLHARCKNRKVRTFDSRDESADKISRKRIGLQYAKGSFDRHLGCNRK